MGWKIWAEAFFVLQFLLLQQFSDGLTNPKDVAAINSLYAAFGTPILPGWVPTGGDPCAEAWQGAQCDTTNIISIILVGANLGGGLGNNLGSFTSIKLMIRHPGAKDLANQTIVEVLSTCQILEVSRLLQTLCSHRFHQNVLNMTVVQLWTSLLLMERIRRRKRRNSKLERLNYRGGKRKSKGGKMLLLEYFVLTAGIVIEEKNWPPFFPLIYHDVANDIPIHLQKLQYIAFTTFLGLGFCLVWNFIVMTTAWIKGEGVKIWLISIIYILTCVPGAYFLWYRPLYRAMRCSLNNCMMVFSIEGFSSEKEIVRIAIKFKQTYVLSRRDLLSNSMQ